MVFEEWNSFWHALRCVRVWTREWSKKNNKNISKSYSYIFISYSNAAWHFLSHILGTMWLWKLCACSCTHESHIYFLSRFHSLWPLFLLCHPLCTKSMYSFCEDKVNTFECEAKKIKIKNMRELRYTKMLCRKEEKIVAYLRTISLPLPFILI